MTDDDRINKLVQAVGRNTAAIKRLETAFIEFAKVHENSMRAISMMRELDQLERERERLERDDPEAAR
jgi:hypothetical protein